jgi:regulatory protein
MSETTPKGIAIDILSRRDNSIREMKQKLKKKGISEEEIEDTIEWLKQKRLLDDRVFAQKKAESIFRIKLCGPKYIESKLRGAGIASEIIDEVIHEIASQEEWEGRARKAVEQWKKIHPKYGDDRVRKMRFLVSRGFTSPSAF